MALILPLNIEYFFRYEKKKWWTILDMLGENKSPIYKIEGKTIPGEPIMIQWWKHSSRGNTYININEIYILVLHTNPQFFKKNMTKFCTHTDWNLGKMLI